MIKSNLLHILTSTLFSNNSTLDDSLFFRFSVNLEVAQIKTRFNFVVVDLSLSVAFPLHSHLEHSEDEERGQFYEFKIHKMENPNLCRQVWSQQYAERRA